MKPSDYEEIYAGYTASGLTPGVILKFQNIIRNYYQENGREFPWRETRDPYHILVSELMLQQTQTSRAITKFVEFIERFPDVQTLAAASLKDVLETWQGLGYNRRAMSLQKCAVEVLENYGGVIPSDTETLLSLPGVGPYTASAVAAIAYDIPAIAIDTNVRAIYHWFFLHDQETVKDKDVLALAEATIDRENPREWYYGLFDYGVALKQQNKQAGKTGVKKPDKFKGSDRDLRGQVIRLLVKEESTPYSALVSQVDAEEDRVRRITDDLIKEGFITDDDGQLKIRE